jgi:hypothetical protein
MNPNLASLVSRIAGEREAFNCDSGVIPTSVFDCLTTVKWETIAIMNAEICAESSCE